MYNDPDFLKEERARCNHNIEQNGVLMKVKKREHDTYNGQRKKSQTAAPGQLACQQRLLL